MRYHDDVIKWEHFPRYWPLVRAGNSPVTGEFPSQRPVTRSLEIFFALGLNKCLSKQSRRWWFETPWRSLWRHCNDDNHLVAGPIYSMGNIYVVQHVCDSKSSTFGEISNMGKILHDEVMARERFPYYWAFVRETTGHLWIILSMASNVGIDVFFNVSLNERLNKQWNCRWFETPWRSL